MVCFFCTPVTRRDVQPVVGVSLSRFVSGFSLFLRVDGTTPIQIGGLYSALLLGSMDAPTGTGADIVVDGK